VPITTALDRVNGWLLGAAIVLLLLAAVEVGFHLARRLGNEHEKALSGVLSAALLALLGLLLAFCFGIVEDRFTTRKMLVIEEANAIGTTYLRADLLPAPHAQRTRDLLRRYTDLRLEVHSVPTLEAHIAQAEALHRQLWQEATAAAAQDPHSVMSGLYIYSLNQTIDLHTERVTVALYHRLPAAMLLTLFAVSMLSLLAHGYGAGLDRRRTLLPTLMLIASVAAVLLVIVELDRPWQAMFRVNQQALVSVRASMSP
jgi:hypothetical protein